MWVIKTSKKDYAKVLKTVDAMRSGIVEFAQELFRAPSITETPGEKEAAEICARKMREHGLLVEFIEAEKDRPNVIGKLRDEEGGLGFSSHIDVVPVEPKEAWIADPFGAEIRENKIYARGAADCKGGMVCAIMAVEALEKAGIRLKGNLQLAAVIDEEVGGKKGMGYVVKQGKIFTPKYCIQGDPANGLDTYTAAHKSTVEIEIATKGKQFHAGSAHKGGISAVLKMTKIIQAMNDQFAKRLPKKPHKLFPEGPTMAAGTTIEGGVNQWMVPDHCTATFIGGVIPYQHTKEDVLNAVESIINDLKREDPELKAEITRFFFKTGDDVPEDEKIVKVLRRAALDALGVEPKPWGVPFCGMSTYLSNIAKIPTIVYGCGSTEFNNTHAPNEWIYVDDLVKVTKVYCLAAMSYLGYET